MNRIFIAPFLLQLIPFNQFDSNEKQNLFFLLAVSLLVSANGMAQKVFVDHLEPVDFLRGAEISRSQVLGYAIVRIGIGVAGRK